MNTSNVWKTCLKDITEHISPQHFTTWFRPIKVLSIEDGLIELEVPSRFFLEWIKDHYLPLIMDILRKNTTKEPSILWHVTKDGKKPVRNAEEEKKAPIKAGASRKTKTIAKKGSQHNLSPKYTFDTFVVGKANEFAQAACSAVSKNLGSKYNPLFIYGGVGLGKTHLLQAIGNRALELDSSTNICYYSSERFMNEFINYVSRQKMNEFRKKFRSIDLLLIDDIQFWGGKERTQEEFFHTFNALHEMHKQIVVTCDRFPKEIDGIEERLRSRFEWGLVADIQPPDTETKVAILKNKAMTEEIELPDDVALWLASVSKSNIRELEGYLNRIIAVSSLTGSEITLPMSKDALKNLTKDQTVKVLSFDKIQKTVSAFFNIKVSDIKGKRRHKAVALPRQIAMYIAREFGGFSYPEIGSSFGGKDHSTAIHAVKKIKNSLKTDIKVKTSFDDIIKLLDVG
ncbi:MAG: chromosomal replication initiator protein DnaA [Deltaproteobacteria bacterium]|nr:chromosomal replication initiator protein DnaA [Deltaproteobacteria bacterium]